VPGTRPFGDVPKSHPRESFPKALKPASKVETAYYNADRAIQQVLDLLAA
jgi:hypothetical protein